MPRESKWYRRRSYLHFDQQISEKQAHRIVTSAENVEKHSFYPFITYGKDRKKIIKDENGRLKPQNPPPDPRPIAYAAHVDSHIYSYYSQILNEEYEKELEKRNISESVLAFRSLKKEDKNSKSGKSNIDFAYEAFLKIGELGEASVLALDITGFFENLDHKILKRIWGELLNEEKLPADHYAIYKSLTRYSTVKKVALYKRLGIPIYNPRKNSRKRLCTPQEFREKVRDLITRNSKPKGIPQGSAISALLSNIYMLEFDEFATQLIQTYAGKYYRYCDDMLFIVPKQSTLESERLEQSIKQQIELLGLNTNDTKREERIFLIENGKTVCYPIEDGEITDSPKPLQYLGFTYDGQKILLRSGAISRYYGKMKQGVKLARKSRLRNNKRRRHNQQSEQVLFKKQLYSRYSYLGKRNFISYAIKSSITMKSASIRQQINPHWKNLQRQIEKES